MKDAEEHKILHMYAKKTCQKKQTIKTTQTTTNNSTLNQTHIKKDIAERINNVSFIWKYRITC